MKRSQVGNRGERLALEYLLQRGYQLIEKNWRCGHLEIDLIVSDGERIRFVEVRSRTAPVLIAPAMTVDRNKRRHLFLAARSYVSRFDIRSEVSFDVVSVVFHDGRLELEYIPDAFDLLDIYYL